jgi:hypothetical protein
LHIAASLDLPRNIGGNVIRPVFKRIERDNPDGVIVLVGQKIVDDGFEVCRLDLGLAVYAAGTKAFYDLITV